ncbi:MAG: hypothetical protein HY875_13470 [Chloroflexi bacterium]|nr:hypothetical protein [Chloroflexota bacterium]
MLTENGLEVDMAALEDVLQRADVLTIGFALFAERLLIDTRTREGEGPLVAVVGPVQTVQERYLWLGQHRGNFGAPEAFSFFVWPKTVRTLIDTDVLATMRARLAAVSPEGESALRDVLDRFAALEREAMRAAVVGDEPWRTVWPQAA